MNRPTHVWCADITLVPERNGFFDLVAIMDWALRKVPSRRLCNMMHADICVEAGNRAIAKRGPPGIMNIVPSSQFTGATRIMTLTEAGLRISMAGGRRSLDTTFNARLWRSMEQGAIRLEKINDGFQVRRAVRNRMAIYNAERPHSALERQTSDDACWDSTGQQKAA